MSKYEISENTKADMILTAINILGIFILIGSIIHFY